MSAPDQGNELDERHHQVASQVDLLVEIVDLPVADQEDEAVTRERRLGGVSLLLPVEPAHGAHPIAVQLDFGVAGPDQAAEVLRGGGVVAGHLLAHAEPYELAGRDAL